MALDHGDRTRTREGWMVASDDLAIAEIFQRGEDLGLPQALSPDALASAQLAIRSGGTALRVDQQLERRIDIREFGAVGDGATNDAAAFKAAFESGYPIIVPKKDRQGSALTYAIESQQTATLAADCDVDFNGALMLFDGGFLGIQSPSAGSALTLSADITRGDASATFSSASGVQEGDIHDFTQATVWETTFNTTRRAIAVVRSVSGNVVTYRNRILLPFAAASTTVAQKRAAYSTRLANLNFKLIGSPANFAMMQLAWLRDYEVLGGRVWSDQTSYSANGQQVGWGLWAVNSADGLIDGIKLQGLSYGIQPANTNNLLITNLRARNCRHPVVPSTGAVETTIKALKTRDCYQSIDSHAAFETHYEDVNALRDESYGNMRCVGGSVSGARIYSTVDDTEPGPFWHSLTLSDLSWYTDAVMSVDRVRITAPNRTKSAIAFSYGHVRLKDVVALVATGTVVAFQSTLQSCVIDGACMNPDGTPWPRAAWRLPVKRSKPPLLNGYLDGVTANLFHIDPYKEAMNGEAKYVRMSGLLFESVTTDPYAFSLRIHTNAFGDYTVPKRVFGTIKLMGQMLHANSGVYGLRSYKYQFYHGYGATSGVIFDTTATETSGVGGQANNTIAITVSNATQSGETQIGAGLMGDGYIQVDVSLTSGGRTTAKLGCAYELEMWVVTV